MFHKNISTLDVANDILSIQSNCVCTDYLKYNASAKDLIKSTEQTIFSIKVSYAMFIRSVKS